MRGMKLIDYAKDRGGSGTRDCPVLTKIARKAGCSASTLYMIARGLKQAGWNLAVAIESATGESVTRHDLRPDVFGAPPADKAA